MKTPQAEHKTFFNKQHLFIGFATLSIICYTLFPIVHVKGYAVTGYDVMFGSCFDGIKGFVPVIVAIAAIVMTVQKEFFRLAQMLAYAMVVMGIILIVKQLSGIGTCLYILFAVGSIVTSHLKRIPN